MVCDSSKEGEVEALFERIKEEQNGRLDILVNNAYAGVQVRHTIEASFKEDASIFKHPLDLLNLKSLHINKSNL